MPKGIAVTRITPRYLKPENTWPTAGSGNEKPKCDNASPTAPSVKPAVAEAEEVRPPGDDRADGDGDQAARHALIVAHAAEPVGQDHREADDADQRRIEHQQARPHRDEGDRDAGERAEQRGARGDAADDRAR